MGAVQEHSEKLAASAAAKVAAQDWLSKTHAAHEANRRTLGIDIDKLRELWKNSK